MSVEASIYARSNMLMIGQKPITKQYVTSRKIEAATESGERR